MPNLSLNNLVIDDCERGIFRVHRSVFTEPEILELERRRVFDACWLYAGHESEVPERGDFVTRRVGGRPVILVRDDDGEVHVWLNTCRHRGNLVCREPSGNAKTFQCFYHAWTFNTRGELIGLPGEDAYSEDFDRKDMGLVHVPRMEMYRGLIFVSFNPAIEGLVAYLGNAKEYLDLALDYSEAGLEIVGGTQAYSMRANWKLLVENSIDGYHALPTHQRYFGQYLQDMGVADRQTGARVVSYGTGRALDNGHAVIESPFGALLLARRAATELEAIRQRLEARFGPERAHKITAYNRNLLIFPNLILIDNWKTVRTFYPIAPDYVEITAWAFLPKEDSPQLRQLRLDNFISFLGPGGFGTPDDVEALENCQRAFATVLEVEWSDISRGMKREQPLATDELQMRTFWRRWHQLMTLSPAARIPAEGTARGVR